MLNASARNTLLERFQRPARTHQMRRLARDLMGDFRYQNEAEFIKELLDEGIVRLTVLKTRNGRKLPLYCSRSLDEISLYELAAAMFPHGYFCNLSSVYFHSLTDQVPGVVYICNETISPRESRPETLPESAIRAAFIKPHRHTNSIVDFPGGAVNILDRVRGSDYGITEIRGSHPLFPEGTRVTCLERALIDAVVAPQYNGGIASVLAVYSAAKRRLRMDRLLKIYRDLHFVYPYAQSIGFMLERAGMKKRAAAMRRAYPPRQKFFVDHNAKTTWIYEERWMLYYPRGLFDED